MNNLKPFPSVEPSATPTRSPFISLDWCSSASTDGTALIYAIEKRNINVVYCLLAKGERLDGRDEKGLTALHHAVLIGENETTLLLRYSNRKDIDKFGC
jgi:ankyrin repeat protein